MDNDKHLTSNSPKNKNNKNNSYQTNENIPHQPNNHSKNISMDSIVTKKIDANENVDILNSSSRTVQNKVDENNTDLNKFNCQPTQNKIDLSMVGCQRNQSKTELNKFNCQTVKNETELNKFNCQGDQSKTDLNNFQPHKNKSNRNMEDITDNHTIEDKNMIDNNILSKINEFSSILRKGTEYKKEIKKFFHIHPQAHIILRRQVIRTVNHEILLIHRIINQKLDTEQLLRSLTGNNLNERNCILLHEMYFYRLVTNFDKVRSKFLALPNAEFLLRNSEEIAQTRIIEKDWEYYEQKKYTNCIIKDKSQDVFRMTKYRDKQPVFLNRKKHPPDFIIFIDLDSFFFKEDLLFMNDSDLVHLKIPTTTEISQIITKNNFKIEKIVKSFPKMNTDVMIIQKLHEKLRNLYKFPALDKIKITKYLHLDYKVVLKKYNKKRCFVLKSNIQYQRPSYDLAYIEFECICEYFFMEDAF